MTRVRMIQSAGGTIAGAYLAGREYKVDADTAKEWLARGIAEPADGTAGTPEAAGDSSAAPAAKKKTKAGDSAAPPSV